jgi:hypothetical protein
MLAALSGCSISHDYKTPWYREVQRVWWTWDSGARRDFYAERRWHGLWRFVDGRSSIALDGGESVLLDGGKDAGGWAILWRDGRRVGLAGCDSQAELSPDRRRIVCFTNRSAPEHSWRIFAATDGKPLASGSFRTEPQVRWIGFLGESLAVARSDDRAMLCELFTVGDGGLTLASRYRNEDRSRNDCRGANAWKSAGVQPPSR